MDELLGFLVVFVFIGTAAKRFFFLIICMEHLFLKAQVYGYARACPCVISTLILAIALFIRGFDALFQICFNTFNVMSGRYRYRL